MSSIIGNLCFFITIALKFGGGNCYFESSAILCITITRLLIWSAHKIVLCMICSSSISLSNSLSLFEVGVLVLLPFVFSGSVCNCFSN